MGKLPSHPYFCGSQTSVVCSYQHFLKLVIPLPGSDSAAVLIEDGFQEGLHGILESWGGKDEDEFLRMVSENSDIMT